MIAASSNACATLGPLTLPEVDRERIDGYRRDQERRGLSPKTLANHLVLLGSMLRLAVELKWLADAPTIAKPKGDPDDDIDLPWLKTRGEIERFLTAARAEP